MIKSNGSGVSRQGDGGWASGRRGVLRPRERRFWYQIYGLQVASQFRLPDLPAISPCRFSDLDIIACALPHGLDFGAYGQGWFQSSEQECQLNLEGVARYRIEQGRRILIDRRMPCGTGKHVASHAEVCLYLLGSVFGILLHQREWLPLHVSALQTPSGVWAFTGLSGAGKSTLAAWLHRRLGWPMVSDDVAVIKPAEVLPSLHPGPPRLKLHEDALAIVGIDKDGLAPVSSSVDKYQLSLPLSYPVVAKPLQALVMLDRVNEGESASLTRLTGIDAFKTIMASVYRADMGKAFNGPEKLLSHVSNLARHIEVYRYCRPWSLSGMEKGLVPLLDRIEGGMNETPRFK